MINQGILKNETKKQYFQLQRRESVRLSSAWLFALFVCFPVINMQVHAIPSHPCRQPPARSSDIPFSSQIPPRNSQRAPSTVAMRILGMMVLVWRLMMMMMVWKTTEGPSGKWVVGVRDGEVWNSTPTLGNAVGRGDVQGPLCSDYVGRTRWALILLWEGTCLWMIEHEEKQSEEERKWGRGEREPP